MSFSTVRITREQLIEESVKILVRDALSARGYVEDPPDGQGWRLSDFPYSLEKLDTNLIATGFQFDDGGTQFELGSNMKERKYTLEFFIFGLTLTWAKALANAIKFSIEKDQAIPLYDITQTPPVQSGEWLELDMVHARREPVPDPEPYQENVFYVVCQVTDWYTPMMT